jgi:hypothetical protein
MLPPKNRFPRIAWPTVALAVTLALAAGCSETHVEVVDPPVDLESDDSLPDGFVADDRPPNPPTTFVMPCPWREVSDPANNPYLVANLGPDLIPSIDEPKYVPVNRASTMLNFERVIACEIDGVVRAFPVRILLHHEIVNMCWDTADGPKYSYLTYCPLVDAGVHFVHPHRCDTPRRQTFGVSGGIFNGNLITFDRSSIPPHGGGPPDLFVQLYAGGINGTCTTVEPQFTSMSWAMFRRLYPEGQVLSEDTGVRPGGGYDFFDHPYSFYWRTGDIWFPLDFDDDRVARVMEPMFGVVTPGATKAYGTRGASYVVNDELGGNRVVVWNDSGLAATTAFQAVVEGQALTFVYHGRESHKLPLYEDEETGSLWTFDGIAVKGPLAGKRLPKVIGIYVFWFAWAALFPETQLYMPDVES